MAQLTRDQLETRLADIHTELRIARESLLLKHQLQVKGQTVSITRTLKDPISGDRQAVALEATITGLRWTYEDDVLMVVTYTHPFTGKVTETEEHMG